MAIITIVVVGAGAIHFRGAVMAETTGALPTQARRPFGVPCPAPRTYGGPVALPKAVGVLAESISSPRRQTGNGTWAVGFLPQCYVIHDQGTMGSTSLTLATVSSRGSESRWCAAIR